MSVLFPKTIIYFLGLVVTGKEKPVSFTFLLLSHVMVTKHCEPLVAHKVLLTNVSSSKLYTLHVRGLIEKIPAYDTVLINIHYMEYIVLHSTASKNQCIIFTGSPCSLSWQHFGSWALISAAGQAYPSSRSSSVVSSSSSLS